MLTPTPRTVTAPGGKLPFYVLTGQEFPHVLSLMATRAPHKVIVRVGGGCANMTADDKNTMLSYFDLAFNGFKGCVWSGGTRQVDADGKLDPMVTDVPGVIAASNPDAVALASTPRTGTFHLMGESQFALDGDGGLANPTVHGMIIVQRNAHDPSDWDGDVPTYVTMMNQLRDHAGFTPVLVTWNGGGVTAKEIEAAIANNWAVVLIAGSGRKTDEYAEKLIHEDPAFMATLPADHKVRVATRQDPMTLRGHLLTLGVLPQPS